MGKTVDVITIDGAKWVPADSLQACLNIKKETKAWFRSCVAKFKFRNKTDWLGSPHFVFSPEAADTILSNTTPLDEYGLPILPPEKRKGPLINPFKF
jgi:hypothetical protein